MCTLHFLVAQHTTWGTEPRSHRAPLPALREDRAGRCTSRAWVRLRTGCSSLSVFEPSASLSSGGRTHQSTPGQPRLPRGAGHTAPPYENNASRKVARDLGRRAVVPRETWACGVWPRRHQAQQGRSQLPPGGGAGPEATSQRAEALTWLGHTSRLRGGKPVPNGNSLQYNVEKPFQESLLFSFRSQGKQSDLLFFVGHRKKPRSIVLPGVELFPQV